MNGKTDKFPSMGYFKTGIVYNSTIFPYWKIDIFSCAVGYQEKQQANDSGAIIYSIRMTTNTHV